MPLIYIQGLHRDEVCRLSIPVAGVFQEVLGSKPEEVYVIWRDSASFQNGHEVDGIVILTVRWVRRPREYFLKIVEALMETMRRELGAERSIEIEVQEQWDTVALNGQLFSERFAAGPPGPRS